MGVNSAEWPSFHQSKSYFDLPVSISCPDYTNDNRACLSMVSASSTYISFVSLEWRWNVGTTERRVPDMAENFPVIGRNELTRSWRSPCIWVAFHVSELPSAYLSYLPCIWVTFRVSELPPVYVSYLPCMWVTFHVSELPSMYLSYLPCI